MKFGILGCRHGHIGDFIREMKQLGHEFVGICETDGTLAPSLAQRYQVPCFKREEDLFAANPDIIGTSAVNNRKIDVIEACSKRGIHVMADKPMVTSMRDFDRLQEIMKGGKIQIGLMLTERFNPPIYRLWQMIRKGELGDIISFSIIKPHKLSEKSRDSWHFDKKENGGVLIDLLIHDFDLLRWFTGSEIKTCHGYMRKAGHLKYEQFYDSVHLVTLMENRVIATLEADWWMPDAYWTWGDGRIFCTGTKGKAEIRTTGDALVKKEPFGLWVTTEKGCSMIPNEVPSLTLTEDFLKRIEGKKDVLITGEDILKATYATLLADQQVERIPFM